MINKKAQWGMDSAVGIVLILILSVGGLFALNMFVDGLAYDNLIKVVDMEIDENCFFLMVPLVRDEYMRGGDKIPQDSGYEKVYNYYSVDEEYYIESVKFKNRFEEYSQALEIMPLKEFDLNDPEVIYGILTTPERSDELVEDTYNQIEANNMKIIFTCNFGGVIYDPAIEESAGVAQIIIAGMEE